MKNMMLYGLTPQIFLSPDPIEVNRKRLRPRLANIIITALESLSIEQPKE
jgi:hypothetical protein